MERQETRLHNAPRRAQDLCMLPAYPGLRAWSDFFSTHPATRRRTARLRSYALNPEGAAGRGGTAPVAPTIMGAVALDLYRIEVSWDGDAADEEWFEVDNGCPAGDRACPPGATIEGRAGRDIQTMALTTTRARTSPSGSAP